MKGKKSYLKNLLLFTQLGLSVVSPILICAAVGWIAMRYWGAKPFVMVILILAGLASGLLCAFRLIGKMVRFSEESDTNAKNDENGKEREDE